MNQKQIWDKIAIVYITQKKQDFLQAKELMEKPNIS